MNLPLNEAQVLAPGVLDDATLANEERRITDALKVVSDALLSVAFTRLGRRIAVEFPTVEWFSFQVYPSRVNGGITYVGVVADITMTGGDSPHDVVPHLARFLTEDQSTEVCDAIANLYSEDPVEFPVARWASRWTAKATTA